MRICADPNDVVIATLVPERGLGRTLSITVPSEARSWTTRDHHSPFQTEITVTVTVLRNNSIPGANVLSYCGYGMITAC